MGLRQLPTTRWTLHKCPPFRTVGSGLDAVDAVMAIVVSSQKKVNKIGRSDPHAASCSHGLPLAWLIIWIGARPNKSRRAGHKWAWKID